MKKIVLLALASLPAIAFAQAGKFAIQGSIGTLNAPAKVYLRYAVDNKVMTDSAELKNGKFELSGPAKAEGVTSAYLMLNTKGTGPSYDDYKQIYLETGTITVTGTDALNSAKVAGTKTNNEKSKYDEATKPVSAGYEALEAKAKAATDEVKNSEAFQKEIHKTEKGIELQSKQIDKKFVQQNPDSYLSIDLLQSLAYSTDYPELAPLYDALSPKVKESPGAKKFAETLPKLKSVAIGATAPEFAEADSTGKIVSITSFRGKYVLIDFWASWCGPCRAENPNVVEAYNRYKNQKFTIVGVSLDQPTGRAKWLAAIKKDGLDWTQLSDLKFWNSQTAGLYGVRAIPQNFLLDPNGKIIAKNLRGDDLNDKLAELFGKM
jgi:peroxiredoxin